MRNRFALRLLTVVLLTVFFFNDWQKASISAATDDEGMIAFCSQEGDYWTIYVMRPIEYDEPKPVFQDANSSNCFPDWSPDGKQLVFARHSASDKHTRIAIGNINDGSIRYVTPDDTDAFFPSYSPDGKMIAFCDPHGEDGAQLAVISVDGSNKRRLITLGDIEAASWSPDARQLAFVALGDKSAQVGVINIDGTGMRFLTDRAGKDSNTAPAWSPDGKQIAFTSNGEIYVMDADGHNPYRLIEGGSPAWSPDSRQIVYEGGDLTDSWLAIIHADAPNRFRFLSSKALKPRQTQWDISPHPFVGPKWSRAKAPKAQ